MQPILIASTTEYCHPPGEANMLERVKVSERSAFLRYFAAIALVAATAGLRSMVDPLSTTDAPLMLFTLVVTAAAWFGGFGAGVVATLFSAVVAVYRFMEPSYQFTFNSNTQIVTLVVFLIEGVAISIFMEHLLRVVETARRSEDTNRELERRILEISEEERRRIGQDLHDGIGQHLTGTSMMAHRLSQRLSVEHSPLAGDAARISGLLNEAIASTRDVGKLLSPPLLNQERWRTCVRTSSSSLACRAGSRINRPSFSAIPPSARTCTASRRKRSATRSSTATRRKSTSLWSIRTPSRASRCATTASRSLSRRTPIRGWDCGSCGSERK